MSSILLHKVSLLVPGTIFGSNIVKGLARQVDIQMTGPDIDLSEELDDEDGSLDEVFSTLWAQFPSDMVQQSPNFRHRTQPAYIKLTLGERDAVSIDLFKTFELPFDAVYIRVCTPIQWRQLVFDKFFPPHNAPLPDNLQNFRQCRYFDSYTSEIARMSTTDALRTREALWALFQELRWVPHPYSERMWSTKRRDHTHGWYALPAGHHTLAVHLAVNPKYFTGVGSITLSSGSRPSSVDEEDDNAAWVELAQRFSFIRNSIPPLDSIFRPGDGRQILSTICHASGAGLGGSTANRPDIRGSGSQASDRQLLLSAGRGREGTMESSASRAGQGPVLLPPRPNTVLPPPLRRRDSRPLPFIDLRAVANRREGTANSNSSRERSILQPTPLRQPRLSAVSQSRSIVESVVSSPEIGRPHHRADTPLHNILGIPSSPPSSPSNSEPDPFSSPMPPLPDDHWSLRSSSNVYSAPHSTASPLAGQSRTISLHTVTQTPPRLVTPPPRPTASPLTPRKTRRDPGTPPSPLAKYDTLDPAML